MGKMTRTVIIGVLALIVSAVGAGYGLFSGYFDRGQFKVEQAQWSPSKKVALVAKRSDHESLNSDQYFVLVADHSLTARELRHAYYNHEVLFRAGSSCLTVHWDGPHSLVVTCGDASIKSDQIAVQKGESGDVMVSYRNIPIGSSRE